MPYARQRLVNPRLGTFFSIFASLFVALILMVLLLEQLGISSAMLSAAVLFLPLMLYIAIGASGYTREVIDYFAAGRRVPAFYSGLLLAFTGVGATGIVALTGTFYIIGFDALCIAIGGLAGFVLMAVLMAPFLRKFGAFTLPSYLGRRFQSAPLRLAAAAAVTVPLLLLIVAEIRFGAAAASLLSGYPQGTMALLLVVVVMATLVAGGMRSQTWSGVAQCIACALALLIPVAIAGVLLTNMPLPQLSHGPILRGIVREENSIGLSVMLKTGLTFGFPGEDLSAIGKRFALPFGSVSPLAFIAMTLSTMCAFAAAPWLLPRVAATPGVYETRKSIGWATVLFGITMITLASVAVFMREYVHLIAKDPAQQVPGWLSQLVALDLAGIDTQSSTLTLGSMSIRRDAVLAALPMASGMPPVVLYMALAGAIAAALAAAGAALTSLASVITEDIVFGLSTQPPPADRRLLAARIVLGASGALVAIMAATIAADPLRLWLWALALTGSALFPVLVLSIWWKRISAMGALAGLLTGFGIAAAIILADTTFIDGALASIIAIPLGGLAAVGVSNLTPAPGRHVLELVRDIRVPGGEILYDREMRLERLKKSPRI